MAKKDRDGKPPAKPATPGGLRSPVAQLALGASAAVAGGVLAVIYTLRRGRGGR